MHLIAIRNLRIDAAQYPDVKKQVDNWYATVNKVEWQNLEDVRQIYRDAEAVGNFTVFNIKGNEYRLIVGIDYENQTVYYKYFLTHAEHNKVDTPPFGKRGILASSVRPRDLNTSTQLSPFGYVHKHTRTARPRLK